MYDIALTVTACLRSGTRVDVAWVVDHEIEGPAPDVTEAVVLTPGGGRVGRLWGGALDAQLAERAAVAGGGRLLSLEIGALEAAAAGLSSGGRARCLMVPASELPESLWGLLDERVPLCLVSAVLDGAVVETRLVLPGDVDAEGADVAELWSRGHSVAAVSDQAVVTILRPVPTLVVAGRGALADALVRVAEVVGWRTLHAPDVSTATGLAVNLGPPDMVVVALHDDEQAGPVLSAALAGRVGYLAALGSRSKRASRERWLAEHGVTGVERIRTPAGLDIGASEPAEVAVAVVAEAIAARAGRRAD